MIFVFLYLFFYCTNVAYALRLSAKPSLRFEPEADIFVA